MSIFTFLPLWQPHPTLVMKRIVDGLFGRCKSRTRPQSASQVIHHSYQSEPRLRHRIQHLAGKHSKRGNANSNVHGNCLARVARSLVLNFKGSNQYNPQVRGKNALDLSIFLADVAQHCVQFKTFLPEIPSQLVEVFLPREQHVSDPRLLKAPLETGSVGGSWNTHTRASQPNSKRGIQYNRSECAP